MNPDINDLINRVSLLNKSNSEKWPVEWQLAWILEELGEVSGEILKLSRLGGRFNPQKRNFNKDSLMEELGDLLYGIISLSTNLEINILEALEVSVKKFESRSKNVIQ